MGPAGMGDLWPEIFSGLEVADPDGEGEKGSDWRVFSPAHAAEKDDSLESIAGTIASTLEVDEDHLGQRLRLSTSNWARRTSPGCYAAALCRLSGGHQCYRPVSGAAEKVHGIDVAGQRNAAAAKGRGLAPAVKRAGRTGKGRTADLARMVKLVAAEAEGCRGCEARVGQGARWDRKRREGG
ncbi:hypothetical protein BDZ91DRAFT_789295 [Kalaharituber pfeilii]|nr:hypothetical protein BDZ91DRAFT_789295 [Kalaharituber pfeilii]